MVITFQTMLGPSVVIAPWPTDRSHKATYQVRCGGCGKFAKVLSFDPGGEYPTYPDPTWVVDCKRCGEGEGYSGPS